jgi:immune inhibitor A
VNSSTKTILAILGVVIVLGICCVCVAGFAGLFMITSNRVVGSSLTTATQTPVVIRPAPPTSTPLAGAAPTALPALETPAIPTQGSAGSSNPAPQPTAVLSSPGPVYTETLQTLENSVVPVNDLLDLAERLQGKKNLPTTITDPNAPYQVGAQKSFWITDVDTNENSQVQATLRYVTGHAYFWVQDNVRFNAADLKALGDTFENKIYPTDREFFGSEWTPGVDGDPHLYILYARGLGSSIAGYFSSTDEYTPEVHKYSNAHEMFMLNADNTGLNENFTYGVLAHEFQHMIHWYRDRNEESWMNEGFSDLAMFLNGYDTGGTDQLYVTDPDIQLTYWPTVPNQTGPHYGAAFLFLTYFLDRFGENATKALVAEPSNGMVSIDQLLADQHITDPQTGKTITADDVFADWEVASYLQDPSVGDGRYTYHNDPSAPRPSYTEQLRSCPADTATRDVSQYGVDYIRITCRGNYTLHFEGSTQVSVVPADPHSGSYAFWSNKGDESDMTLTRSFDFTNANGPLTLQYWTWYDLEKDYDYLYVEASTDGQTWQILKTPSGTDQDPSGNSYGWGYNGESGGGSQPAWIQESVDLSTYAGKQVQIRFEYVTDAAVNGEGLLLDDVSVPQINYRSDFESDDGGWKGDGFVRIQNVLPQTFRLELIQEGGAASVQDIAIPADNQVDIPIQIGGNVRDAVLVVSGTTRFTHQKAAYRYSVNP